MPPVIFRQGSGRVVSSVLRFATGTLTQSAGEAVYTPPGGGGGGGPWGSTGITGTANRFAIFDGTGSPSFLAYPSTGLVAWTGTAWAATTIDAPLAYSGGHLSVDLSAYLTTASASSTYLTISSAASSYQPLDSDLTGLAGLGNGLPYRAAGVWTTSTDYLSALAGSYGTPGSANVYVTTTDPRLTGTGGPSGGAGAIAAYGQARDGDANFNGVNPVTNWTLAGSTYTYTGTTEINLEDVIVANNVILKTQGFGFFCRSATCGTNVVFDFSGGSGSGVTAGLGALPSTIATSSAGATFYGGEDGGVGRNSNAAGASAPALSAGALRGGGLGGASGRARISALQPIAAAGAAGTGTGTAGAPWYYGDAFKVLFSGLPYYRTGTAIAQIAGGTGGGGAPLSTAGTSGAGGGGGGVCVFAAATATFGTGCVFSVDGGAGAAGVAGANSVAAGGAGGGGGIGACTIGEITGSNLPTFYARGGAGGAATIAGAGLWAEGGNGGNGGYWYVYFGTTPGTPIITVTGGAGGANAGSGTGFIGSSAGSNGASYFGKGG